MVDDVPRVERNREVVAMFCGLVAAHSTRSAAKAATTAASASSSARAARRAGELSGAEAERFADAKIDADEARPGTVVAFNQWRTGSWIRIEIGQ